MTSTADRYREAGMPPPRGEVAVTDVRRSARRARPLPLATTDPADLAGPPEPPAAPDGSDSVPLDMPDTDSTEETS